MIYVLILQRSPEPFREDIVKGSPLAIHAYSDIPIPETSKILFTGEMTPLVAVPYDGTGAFKCAIDLQRFQYHAGFEIRTDMFFHDVMLT